MNNGGLLNSCHFLNYFFTRVFRIFRQFNSKTSNFIKTNSGKSLSLLNNCVKNLWNTFKTTFVPQSLQ